MRIGKRLKQAYKNVQASASATVRTASTFLGTLFWFQVGLEGSALGQWWLDMIGKTLDEGSTFERVGSRQLAGLLISIWFASTTTVEYILAKFGWLLMV